eukprot:TRINITY_DN10661_c0_g1_i1.p1 TRINITY_DN10661_c0_g1~~TRINITY_DN10661_c0_g1_i1.p1  ORF type:complete len:204 (-),score=29.73 TRINITY_DN10661_c0_g1_i1:59-628(-)
MRRACRLTTPLLRRRNCARITRSYGTQTAVAEHHGEHHHDEHHHGAYVPGQLQELNPKDWPDPVREYTESYGHDIGNSTVWERKDDKVFINQYTGRLERWIDVEELFTDEYWEDPYNWDVYDYSWKLQVDRVLGEYLGITDPAQQKQFRKDYELSTGHGTLEWIIRSPPDEHNFEEPIVIVVNPHAPDH